MMNKYVIYLHFILILSVILINVKCDSPDNSKLKHLYKEALPVADYKKLPENKQETNDTEYISKDQNPDLNSYQLEIKKISPELDPEVKYDEKWASKLSNYSIKSAVDLDLNGNVAVLCTRDRIWDAKIFDSCNNFNRNCGPIKDDTIVLINKQGEIILSWGRNMFFLPHGLTIDHLGNYWLTDVGLHQVFKFDNQDIQNLFKMLNNKSDVYNNYNDEDFDRTNIFKNSIIKPSLILGKAFEPGDDSERFCKPTSVAVMKNGDFFVADGYCNSRIIKFNSNGERILTIGRDSSILTPYPLEIPHSLALAEEYNYLFIADINNGTIACHFANNGTFHKAYKHPSLGFKLYSIAYRRNHLYIVNGFDSYGRRFSYDHVFIVDVRTNELITQFGLSFLTTPQDIAVSRDETEIFVIKRITFDLYRYSREIPFPQTINKKNNNVFEVIHRIFYIVNIVMMIFIFVVNIFIRYILYRVAKSKLTESTDLTFQEPKHT